MALSVVFLGVNLLQVFSPTPDLSKHRIHQASTVFGIVLCVHFGLTFMDVYGPYDWLMVVINIGSLEGFVVVLLILSWLRGLSYSILKGSLREHRRTLKSRMTTGFLKIGKAIIVGPYILFVTTINALGVAVIITNSTFIALWIFIVNGIMVAYATFVSIVLLRRYLHIINEFQNKWKDHRKTRSYERHLQEYLRLERSIKRVIFSIIVIGTIFTVVFIYGSVDKILSADDSKRPFNETYEEYFGTDVFQSTDLFSIHYFVFMSFWLWYSWVKVQPFAKVSPEAIARGKRSDRLSMTMTATETQAINERKKSSQKASKLGSSHHKIISQKNGRAYSLQRFSKTVDTSFKQCGSGKLGSSFPKKSTIVTAENSRLPNGAESDRDYSKFAAEDSANGVSQIQTERDSKEEDTKAPDLSTTFGSLDMVKNLDTGSQGVSSLVPSPRPQGSVRQTRMSSAALDL